MIVFLFDGVSLGSLIIFSICYVTPHHRYGDTADVLEPSACILVLFFEHGKPFFDRFCEHFNVEHVAAAHRTGDDGVSPGKNLAGRKDFFGPADCGRKCAIDGGKGTTMRAPVCSFTSLHRY
jgi:hypothetical protein